ncbi:hypothetical protein ACQKLX_22020 [Bosea sp. NPDC003192]|jgi:hypothetical protein|uniref:hypothetical protein n=1 Tax=Bosea sp. NPDC003192 TaxID=3390551 RepID=UPI003D009D25
MRHLLIAAALFVGSVTAVSAAPAAPADAPLAPALARQLDRLPAEFTASDAKLRRMQIIQNNLDRQRYGRGGGGYGRGGGYGGGYGYGRGGGYGYGRGYGGPPPYGYGYRRHGYYDRW